MSGLFYFEIQKIISNLSSDSISESRKKHLDELVKIATAQSHELSFKFMGFRNSHRSIYAQVWSNVLATQFSLPIKSFSGGFESSSVKDKLIKTLESQGFKILKKRGGKEQVYFVLFSDEQDPITIYSKKHDDPINPPSDFIAISMSGEIPADFLESEMPVFNFYKFTTAC